MIGYITEDERVADPMETILSEFILLAKPLVKGKSIDVRRDTAMKGGVEVRDRLRIGKLLHCGANQRDGGCVVPISIGQSILWLWNGTHKGASSDKLSRWCNVSLVIRTLSSYSPPWTTRWHT